ncbi:hypothetical protein [Halobellus marinus]|uniref:hypothetical protein n=1 Tax=Halobellus TaxID=1073986 RepID=UPI0028ACAC6F|nr:hypothetical protein [Halobellus sp. DFY28]
MAKRRQFIISLGLAVGLAGCSGDPDTDSGGDQTQSPTDTPTSTPTDTPTDTATSTQTETPTDSPTPEPTESEDVSYQVRIVYDGEWQGSISAGSTSRSIDGSGTDTYDIDGDPFIVSANAQKNDDSSRELTVQILQDGEVIADESTTSEYGIAQVTSEDDTSGGGDGGGSESSFSVRIQYSGEWQGSVGSGGSIRSVDGSGTETFDIEGSPDIISANAQKQDDSSDTLTVQILENGEVVKESSTSAEYGLAQVSYSNF